MNRYPKPTVEIIEDTKVISNITDINSLSHAQRMELFAPSDEHIYIKPKSNGMTFEQMVKNNELAEFKQKEYEKSIISKPKSNNGLKYREKYENIDGYGFNISIESDMDIF